MKKKISKSEMYYVMALLVKLYSNDKKSVGLPELSLLIDEDSIYNLVSVMGGMSIYIPSKEEFEEVYLKSLIYLYTKSGYSFFEIKKLLPTDDPLDVRVIKRYYNEIAVILTDHKLPNKDDNGGDE